MKKWLVAAVALHASLLLLMRTGVERNAVPKDRFSEPPAGATEIELDLDTSIVWSRDNAARRGPRTERSPLAAPGAPPVSRAPLFALPVPTGEEPSAAPADELIAEPSTTTPEPNAPNAPNAPNEPNAVIDLGIGANAWQRWLPRPAEDTALGERAETPKSGRYQPFRPPPVSTTGGVQEGLEAHTRALGLGPSGRVISAFHQAARAAEAPQIGKASFQVTVTQAGTVEIALASSTAPIAGWQAVATKAAAEIRRALPRIPGGRAGVRLIVELVAEEVMPNGLRTKDLHRAGVTPLGALQGGFDFAGAGSKPQRIVRATTHEEVLF